MKEIRLRFGKGARKRFDVPDAKREAELRALASALSTSGLEPERAERILRDAAKADAGELATIKRLVAELAAGDAHAKPRAQLGVTFRELADDWVKGELHRKWPDHVKKKKSVDDDEGRLDRLYETIGDVRLEAFTLEDAERAMASLPEGKTTATRRQYAQLISKVLRLAVYPCRIIERSPLPVGFLPKPKGNKATAYLYPEEDAALMKATVVPIARRLLYGFLAREGMRVSEATGLTWRDLDLVRGVVTLDENKTDDPRAWALGAGTTAALKAFKPEGIDASAPVFTEERPEKLADTFREDLRQHAKVDRAALYERTATRLPIRAHDLRATFVTLNLAAGKSETWVADRTGHKSSAMINRYRRQARQAVELHLGELLPLNVAIPELAPKQGPEGDGPGSGPESGPKSRPVSQSQAARPSQSSVILGVPKVGVEPTLYF